MLVHYGKEPKKGGCLEAVEFDQREILSPQILLDQEMDILGVSGQSMLQKSERLEQTEARVTNW